MGSFWFEKLMNIIQYIIQYNYKRLLYIHAAKSLQSCLTLCDPIDGSPPGSPVPGILQARTLEWVAISLSNTGKWKVKVKSLSRVRLLATPWTAAYQAPLSMGFSRQEYWSGVPLPSPSIYIYAHIKYVNKETSRFLLCNYITSPTLYPLVMIYFSLPTSDIWNIYV